RSVYDALAIAEQRSNARLTSWVVEDLKDAFGRIPRNRLLDVMRTRITDERTVALIDVLADSGKKRGIEQGSPLSPLLLNTYLDHLLDKPWEKRFPNWPLIRWADDILVTCPTEKDAREAREELGKLLTPAGMTLKGNPTTSIKKLSAGESAEWLGFELRINGGMEARIAEARWWKLEESLEQAHTQPMAPLVANAAITGWLDQLGPTYGYEEVREVTERIARTACGFGFDEIPDEKGLRDCWERAHGRWQQIRQTIGVSADVGAGGSACLTKATKRRNGEGALKGASSPSNLARADCIPPSTLNVTPARREGRRQSAGDPVKATALRAASSTNGASKMQKPKPKKRIEFRPLADLRPHPRQADLFGECSDQEIEELAADIGKNGLAHAIEITPDGIIIAGHRRVKAYWHLKRTKVCCWVREDLEELGEQAIEQRLIEDNLNRRQLSKLDQARLYAALRKIRGNDESDNGETGDIRDILATRFGVSGRTLDRWRRMLAVPREIQRAVELQMLTLSQGTKIADLPPSTQNEIAERIRNGENPKHVFNIYRGASPVRKSSIETTIAKLVRAIDDCENVRGKIGDSTPATVTNLKRAARKLNELVTTIEAKPPLGKQRPAKQTR
ncbi:MAG: ParB N-terminal domain-containing protein, partial [Pirellulaceae bacterium]|nr:ParB N-terminal domain-containing protein [Pirellulaceae bacterium]